MVVILCVYVCYHTSTVPLAEVWVSTSGKHSSQGLASTKSEIHHKYNIKWVEVCIISWAPQEWDSIELIQTLQKFRREMCLLGVRLTPKEWDLRALGKQYSASGKVIILLAETWSSASALGGRDIGKGSPNYVCMRVALCQANQPSFL